MILKWEKLDPHLWQQELCKVLNPNWMQSYGYALAAFKRDYKLTRLACFYRTDEKIALALIQEIKFGPIHFVFINRGPLWLKEPTAQDLSDLAQCIRNEFPKRFLRRVRWLCDWKDKDQALEILTGCGFNLCPENFQTIMLNLPTSDLEMRKQLFRKWRNRLHKAESFPIKTKLDLSGVELESFLANYSRFKISKDFIGPSEKYLRTELSTAFAMSNALIITASMSTNKIAEIVITWDGNTAVYRASWNSLEGKQYLAHYLLVWKSLQFLILKGLKHFDLGGILPKESPEVTQFKDSISKNSLKIYDHIVS